MREVIGQRLRTDLAEAPGTMRSLAIALSIAAVGLVGCADSEDDALFDLDHEAAAADGKADAPGGIVRLDRTTPTELTDAFSAEYGAKLATCWEAYRAEIDDTGNVTAGAASELINLAGEGNTVGPCNDWHNLGQIIEGVLIDADELSMPIEDVIGAIGPWAASQIVEAADAAGYMNVEAIDLLFYGTLVRVQTELAKEREQNPTGISLATIRTQWDEVRNETTLDRAYLNPVTFAPGALDGNQIFANLRAAFPLKGLSLASTGYTAVSDFAAADEGPEGDAAFTPIATALRKRSIKKRFYFARTGEWSSNVLIVVDERGQAWGFQMGYSE